MAPLVAVSKHKWQLRTSKALMQLGAFGSGALLLMHAQREGSRPPCHISGLPHDVPAVLLAIYLHLSSRCHSVDVEDGCMHTNADTDGRMHAMRMPCERLTVCKLNHG